jgi:hypothetical protein
VPQLRDSSGVATALARGALPNLPEGQAAAEAPAPLRSVPVEHPHGPRALLLDPEALALATVADEAFELVSLDDELVLELIKR